MVGYIGERAKRRRRNFILVFVFILIFFIFYYIYPLLKLPVAKPTNNLLPTEQEVISPVINTTVEELELQIFDKEQKIMFRNNQIEKFKDEIKNLSLENTKLLESIQNLNSIINSSSNNIELIKNKEESTKKNQINEIKKFKNIILEIETKNEDLLLKISNYEINNATLTNEFKAIINKNLKLKNSNKEIIIKIDKLEDFIEEQNLIIQLLKDKNPHG